MNRRDTAIALLALGAASAPIPGIAQVPKSGQRRRTGILSLEAEGMVSVTLRDLPVVLRKLGWIEGDNLVIERAYADLKGERLAGLASDLVKKRVEVILSLGSQATLAAARATQTIPIVFWSVAWAVERGFIDSFARPGRNLTGVVPAPQSLRNKRLQFLREIVPTATRLAWLWLPGQEETVDGRRIDLTVGMQSDASSLGFETRFYEIRPSMDVGSLFVAIGGWPAHVITVATSSDPLGQQIAEHALRQRLASAFMYRRYLQAGGLLSYNAAASEYELLIARSIENVDRILRGARPADLPVEQAKKFELTINLKTAKALGLTVPPSLLLRADEVIQ